MFSKRPRQRKQGSLKYFMAVHRTRAAVKCAKRFRLLILPRKYSDQEPWLEAISKPGVVWLAITEIEYVLVGSG